MNERPRYSSWLLERVAIGEVIRLRIGSTTIGRHPQSSIKFPDANYVSRQHAEVNIPDEDRSITIRDLNSSNGIFVNGMVHKGTHVELKAGDRFGVGMWDEENTDPDYPLFVVKFAPIQCKAMSGAAHVEKPMTDESRKGTDKPINREALDSATGATSKRASASCAKRKSLVAGTVISLLDDDDEDEDDVDGHGQPAMSATTDSSFHKESSIPTVISQNVKAASNNCESDDVADPDAEPELNVHQPIIPSVKLEKVRHLSDNITSIFGEANDVILDAIKDINPLYRKLNDKKTEKRPLIHGDCISLCSDDDDDDNRNMHVDDNLIGYLVMDGNEEEGILTSPNEDKEKVVDLPLSKSPNLFESSLNNSKNDDEPKFDCDLKSTSGNRADVSGEKENLAKDYNEDDLMFSQILLNDMKAEFEDDFINDGDGDEGEGEDQGATNHEVNNDRALLDLNIKIEPEEDSGRALTSTREELEESCWVISDDDEYDEELESKVSGWSNKLFSQNRLHLSMSQVYETQDERSEMAQSSGSEQEREEDVDDGVIEINEVDEICDFYNHKEHASPVPGQERIDDEICEKQRKDTKKEDGEEEETKTEGLRDVQVQSKANIQESPLVRNARERAMRIPSSSEDEDMDSIEVAMEDTHSKQNETVPCAKRKEKTAERVKVNEEKFFTPLRSDCRGHPAVIPPPSLPKHRGKLRGVSAAAAPQRDPNEVRQNKMATIRAKERQERHTNDLKRKWLEKPNIAKKRAKEQNRRIRESRKERLKQLTNKQSTDEKMGVAEEQKSSLDSVDECTGTRPKVKVTTMNRGAVLANELNGPMSGPPSKKKKFVIPKRNGIAVSADSVDKANVEVDEAKHLERRASLNLEHAASFSQQISEPDRLLLKRHKSVDGSKCHNNAELPATTMHPVQPAPRKDALAARAQRTTNKISFASMQKSFDATHKNQEQLEQLSTRRSCLQNVNKPSTGRGSVDRPKKSVRFNETPVVHYIERVLGAVKKVNAKDVMPRSTHIERRQMVRGTFRIANFTDRIISLILGWSNEWLVNRNAEVDAAVDLVMPMPNVFTSFNHYKSIIFPLMKMEFISMLEREYQRGQAKPFKVTVDYVTENKDRLMLMTKLSPSSRAGVPKCDLVTVDLGKSLSTFAYISAKRNGAGSCRTLVLELMPSNQLKLQHLNAIKELNVRPVVDNVRVEFGAFNAVFQVESTPLFPKILNPLELLKCKPLLRRNVNYKGCDELTDNQKHVLLGTYVKITEETVPNITLIKGPPGTGKSRVITNLALQTLYGSQVRCLDMKVLICAQSNAAVDVIAEKLMSISRRMRPEIMFRLVRYGVLSKINPIVQPISLQKIMERNQIRKLKDTYRNLQVDNKENVKDYLRDEIKQLGACIEDLKLRCTKGTVQEVELHEKQRQLQLMQNIVNGSMRPEDERSISRWYLQNANIICATLSSCVKLLEFVDYFDVCIIDEATQCTEPWTLVPLQFGINSLVLVGDTQQLPATVLSKKAYDFGLGTSLFTRIQQCLETVAVDSNGKSSTSAALNSTVFGLQSQFRMHPEICKWPNLYFYKNELINASITLKYTTPLMPFSILNLSYTQNENCRAGQIINDLEAKFVAKLLKALDGYIPTNYNSYGVITPYAQQRNALEAALRNAGLSGIMVNTIDSYQGTEKDVIVISNARTVGIGFLSHHQRLNVALTRPKKCLILCGNFKHLESVAVWRSLLNNARERNLFHEISASCLDDDDIHKNVIDKIKLKK